MSHEGIRFSTREEHNNEEQENHKLPRTAVTPQKVRVLMTEGKGMEIDWADGHKSAWGFAWLRDACPCATCIEERTQQGRKPGQPPPKPAVLLPMYAPPPKPASAQPVGRYALQFNWQDGHSAGIYSWEYLRRMCQCGECRLAATETSGVAH
jgi:DUF971 family protein